MACRAREESGMTYVVTEACIRCKFNDCVAICPVDCFYEGESMLVIHPDECIDCGACVPACPTDAIMLGRESGAEAWLELNKRFCEIWPNINKKGETPADAESYVGMADKYDKYFSENPGK